MSNDCFTQSQHEMIFLEMLQHVYPFVITNSPPQLSQPFSFDTDIVPDNGPPLNFDDWITDPDAPQDSQLIAPLRGTSGSRSEGDGYGNALDQSLHSFASDAIPPLPSSVLNAIEGQNVIVPGANECEAIQGHHDPPSAVLGPHTGGPTGISTPATYSDSITRFPPSNNSPNPRLQNQSPRIKAKRLANAKLNAHNAWAKPRKHICSMCGATFPRPNALKMHENIHLPPDQRPTTKCELCPRTFANPSNATRHLTKHHGEAGRRVVADRNEGWKFVHVQK